MQELLRAAQRQIAQENHGVDTPSRSASPWRVWRVVSSGCRVGWPRRLAEQAQHGADPFPAGQREPAQVLGRLGEQRPGVASACSARKATRAPSISACKRLMSAEISAAAHRPAHAAADPPLALPVKRGRGGRAPRPGPAVPVRGRGRPCDPLPWWCGSARGPVPPRWSRCQSSQRMWSGLCCVQLFRIELSAPFPVGADRAVTLGEEWGAGVGLVAPYGEVQCEIPQHCAGVDG